MRFRPKDRRIGRRTQTSFSAQLALAPSLSAIKPDLAVLGRQHRADALCRGPRASDNRVLRALDRSLPAAVAVRTTTFRKRLARFARGAALVGAVVGGGVRLQQRAVQRLHAIYVGAQRALDPVLRAAVHRAVVTGAV